MTFNKWRWKPTEPQDHGGTSACCLTDQLASAHCKIKRITLNIHCWGQSETCPCAHRSTLTSLMQHGHTGSGADYRGECRGYLFTVRASVERWSSASPAEGLLCGDAIITTTLPPSIYSSQSALSLSLSLSVSLSHSPF